MAVPVGLNVVAGWFGVAPDPNWGMTAAASLGLHKVLVDAEKAEREMATRDGAYLVRLNAYRRPLLRMVQEKARTIGAPAI